MTDREALIARLRELANSCNNPHLYEKERTMLEAAEFIETERAKQAEPCGCRIGECESKKDRLCRMQAEIKEGGHQ